MKQKHKRVASSKPATTKHMKLSVFDDLIEEQKIIVHDIMTKQYLQTKPRAQTPVVEQPAPLRLKTARTIRLKEPDSEATTRAKLLQ